MVDGFVWSRHNPPVGVPDIPKILFSRHFRRIFLRQIFPTLIFAMPFFAKSSGHFRRIFLRQLFPPFCRSFLRQHLGFPPYYSPHTHTMGAVGRWQPPLVAMIATSYRQKQHYNSSSTAVEDVATYLWNGRSAGRRRRQRPAPADDDSSCVWVWGGVGGGSRSFSLETNSEVLFLSSPPVKTLVRFFPTDLDF
jgi:hypothetical protein